eukprot:2530220-Pleurochrysis_carterae.AAC.1
MRCQRHCCDSLRVPNNFPTYTKAVPGALGGSSERVRLCMNLFAFPIVPGWRATSQWYKMICNLALEFIYDRSAMLYSLCCSSEKHKAMIAERRSAVCR